MRPISSRVGRAVVLLAVVLWGAAAARGGQLTPDEAATLVLDGARRAHNEKNYAVAAERFREFLRLYRGRPGEAAAYYGLGLTLLKAPQRDYKGAAEALGQASRRGDLPDRPHALFYLGVAQRSLGDEELAQARAKPNEAPHRRNTARQRFEEAARSFSEASTAFAAQVKILPAAERPPALEWAARARCDQCDMLLRIGKFREAGDLARGFLANPRLSGGRYRPLALYHLGYACFAQKDHLAAGRALSRLAPFRQEFGGHARYLLGRTHHLSGERPEAAAQYEAARAAYAQQKQRAQDALRNPAALEPERKAHLDAVSRGPTPAYVVRASFYLALVASEDGRYADALGGFTAFIQKHPKDPLIPEAQLRQGFCQMQLRNHAEAIKILQPLGSHPQLADQALWWLARARVAAADPKNAQTHAQALAAAMAELRRAADRAAQMAQKDPHAKARRGDILLELADTMQLAGKHKDAAAMYQTVLNEGNNPDRAEEAMQRRVTALHLAGMYKESDDLGAAFERTYPQSTLLPAVWFRAAENAFAAATAAAAKPDLPNREQELERLFGQAIARYQRLLARFPEFPNAGLARYGLAKAYCRLGRRRDAVAALSAIPEADRVDELAGALYLLADCLLRTLPAEAGDAVQAARLHKQVGQAAVLLQRFVGAQPKDPRTPDALLKLGHCYQRTAGLLADQNERRRVLTLARGVYERLVREFGRDPSAPTAAFELAACLALLGDTGRAVGELGRFQSDPFARSPVAPLALLRLSRLTRAQRRAADAANLMAQCRTRHEANLLKDPARAHWVPLLQYEHGLAIQESGKAPEARAVFEALAKQFPTHPQTVNALWRAGQCHREELTAGLALARQALARHRAGSKEAAAALEALDDGLKGLRRVARALRDEADELDGRAAGSEPHQHLLYEAAWCYRALAEAEIEAARQKLQRAALERVQAKMPGPPPSLRPPGVPRSALSVRLAERAAHERYRRLIAAAPLAPLAVRARLELAEMLAQREDHDAVLKLLADALGTNPPKELADQFRLRLAAAFLAKNKSDSALPHVEAILKDSRSRFAAHARYLAGEAHVQKKDWPRAIELLRPFRDDGRYHNVAGISDRALLALGRACSEAGQWDGSRHALKLLVERFRTSPWVAEALYLSGRAWQSQKQYDNAAKAYVLVTQRTASEWGARAQLQLGLCRLAQQRHAEAVKALVVVPYTYDYPELSAQAWCEAGRAHLAMKQPAEAARLWRRVMRDHAKSPWASTARKLLAARR